MASETTYLAPRPSSAYRADAPGLAGRGSGWLHQIVVNQSRDTPLEQGYAYRIVGADDLLGPAVPGTSE